MKGELGAESARCMVEWAPIKGVVGTRISNPLPHPLDTTTLLVARYLLIRTLVARQLLQSTKSTDNIHSAKEQSVFVLQLYGHR